MFKWVCPVCDSENDGEFPSSNVCDICTWEQDVLQEDDPDDDEGANKISLNEARAEWEASQVEKQGAQRTAPQRAVV